LQHSIQIETNPGHLIVSCSSYPYPFPGVLYSSFAEVHDDYLRGGIRNSWLGFGMLNLSSACCIRIPMWFPIFFAASLAGVGWLPWPKRFTTRTLLIATTLVAVVLGIVVWLR
jgi:hypothetical protein